MLLYIWIEKYRNIRHLGFNLSSQYEFKFEFKKNAKTPSGILTANEIHSAQLFKDYFWDLKALIGKNGTGKSSFVEATIQNILTDYPKSFTGFIVTDKYILNRSGIAITHPNIKIAGEKLKEIRNADISNFHRPKYHRKLSETQASKAKGARIINTFLDNYAIFYYSLLINYDRVYESGSPIAGHQAFEVDYHRYFDISTESQIVADYNRYVQSGALTLKSESEILTHKSMESFRILNYLLDRTNESPFKVNIPVVTVHLNEIEQSYWEDISLLYKQDNLREDPFMAIIHRLRTSSMKHSWAVFEEEILLRILLHLVRYEVNERYNFGTYGNLNPMTHTISFFQTISEGQTSIKDLLNKYLQTSDIFKFEFKDLGSQIKSFILFLKANYQKGIIRITNYSFNTDFTQTEFLKEFINRIDQFHGERKNSDQTIDKLLVSMPIFSFDYRGLSSGEKSFLHMLSRFSSYIKLLTPETKNVIVFLDEPEVSFHPQWQKEFITIICKFFKKQLQGKTTQLIITSHSPIIISDLPKENIIFLDIDSATNSPVITSVSTDNTFASNIHTLYTDAFFIQKGTIGEFAKQRIKEVIDILKERDVEQKERASEIIKIIGDKLIRQRLEEMFKESFESEPENLDEKIARLEHELARAKSRKK